MSGSPAGETPDDAALQARLRAVGVEEERVAGAARELAARLIALASVDDERLEGTAPAVRFVARA